MTLQEKLKDAMEQARKLANDENSDVSELETAMGEVRRLQNAIRDAAKKDLGDDTEKDDGTAAPDTPATDDKDATEPADESDKDTTEPADESGTPADESNSSDKKKKDDEKRDELDDYSDDNLSDADDDPDIRDNRPESETRDATPTNKGGQTVTTKITEENKNKEIVRSLEDYVRNGQVRANDGLTTTDVGVMVPEQIIYDPSAEINSVFDLSTLVTSTSVTTASGTYPILKRATAQMHTVAELQENPALAKPEFINVEWKINTYRGAIPISEESIQDSQVPLMPVIQQNAKEQRVNTLNAGISALLKGFNPVTVKDDASLVDSIKHVLNVQLDPAYNKTVVITQSAYDVLDQLKDKEGRYLLQTDVTSATGLRLLGYQLVVVNDELLGSKAGDVAIWIGDLKRAILFPKRVDTAIEWEKNEIYGRYLGLVMRFGLVKADSEAGYYLSTSTKGATPGS